MRSSSGWPGVAGEVEDLCTSCPTCQKAGPAIRPKGPFHPLPVMTEPFERIAMDVFSPLTQTINMETITSWSSWPRALSGQRYLRG